MTTVDCEITTLSDGDPFDPTDLIDDLLSALFKVVDDTKIGDDYPVKRVGSVHIGSVSKGMVLYCYVMHCYVHRM